MTINSDKNLHQMETFIYEKPSLKKYGTMKDLTLGAGGSSSDLVAQACTTSCAVAGKQTNSGNTIQDPDVVGDFSNLANDSIFSLGNDNDDIPTSVDGNQD